MSGPGDLAAWSNQLRDQARSQRILRGPGIRVKESPLGTTIEVIPRGGAGRSSPGATISMYQITGLANADYVTGQIITGVDIHGVNLLSGVSVSIAKDWHLRTSLAQENIDGVLLNYSQLSDNQRLASDGTNSEIEVMFPRYKMGGILWAMQSSNGTGVSIVNNGVPTPVKWLELKPARVWARRYLQV